MQVNQNPDTMSEDFRFREVARLLGTALHRWYRLNRKKRTRISTTLPDPQQLGIDRDDDRTQRHEHRAHGRV